MAPREAAQPYMVYMGPRPVRPVAEALNAEAAARAVEDWRKAHPEFGKAGSSGGERSGLVAAVGGALVAGLTLGIWIGPTLRPVATVDPAPAAMASLPEAPVLPAPRLGHAPPDRAMIAAQALFPSLGRVHTDPTPAPRKARLATAKTRHGAASPMPRSAARPADEPDSAAAEPVGCKPGASRLQVTLCADATIAAADQDMKRAYQRALKSGAPVRALRAQQDDWQAASETAAARSPGDLASAYRQRIDELNALADDPPH